MSPIRSLSLALSIAVLVPSARAEVYEADIVIFGGTSGGIAAAVQARRMGKTAIIAEWTQHVGGLTTGGLGATDIGNKGAIGGIAREFYEEIAAHYAKPAAWKWQPADAADQKHERAADPIAAKTGRPTKWTFEPSVAAAIYQRWLAAAGVTVQLGEKLAAVKKVGTRIIEFSTEKGNVYRGRMFIDASYEGDLMAKAGVPYHVGREANSDWGETLNGVRAETPKHQFTVDVDPYVRPGDPASGLLPFIQSGPLAQPGSGDKAVQAYNFRLCMTRTEANRIPWSALKPEGYDEAKFELLARYLEGRTKSGQETRVGTLMNPVMMPNDKTDTNNNGGFSTDFIGANYAYPDADYATREQIIREHENYTKGFLYFLATSPRVPKPLQQEMNAWGLAKDEFTENGGFPTQMYVREARRMISDYVATEADCRWKRKAEDPVGMGAYNMDSHNCQRLVQNGVVRNEGDVQVAVSGPYPISYRSIIPKAMHADNLLVPVCLAATHIAYGSIRMEPVFMIMGQSAATAAVFAIESQIPIQHVNYAKLRSRLEKDGQVLVWAGPAREALPPPPKLDGVVLDDTAATKTGAWHDGTLAAQRRIGDGYVHDANENKGACTARWTTRLAEAGEYEVLLHYPPNQNRATNLRVAVEYGGTSRSLRVNQRETSGVASLGRFKFPANQTLTVSLTNAGTDGHVVLDGIQIIRR